MVTADPAVQASLLELQRLDTRLDQIAHRRATLPSAAQAAELDDQLSGLRDDVVLLATKVSDLDREVARSEADVATVRARAERDRVRLEAGQGSAKDLVGLQHELESLARRQSQLEDGELDAMERRETQAGLLGRAREQQAEVEERLAGLVTERDAAFAELDAERDRVTAEREAIAADLTGPLMAVYARLRDRLGVGAARLDGTRCEGCHMDLSPSDLDALHRLPATEVVRCPECERILVRDAPAAGAAPSGSGGE